MTDTSELAPPPEHRGGVAGGRRRARLRVAAAAAAVMAGAGIWSCLKLSGGGSAPISLAATGAPDCSVPTITVRSGEGIRATTLLPGMQLLSTTMDRMAEYGIPNQPSAPRVDLTLQPPGPLAPPVVPPGPDATTPVLVAGRPAVAVQHPDSGGPINVYWRLSADHGMALAAWNMTEAQALTIASGVVYDPGVTHTLSTGPGPTITRQQALTAAGARASGATGVLTGWSEWAALAQPSGPAPPSPPAGIDPWHPVWVVATNSAGAHIVSIVDATSGTLLTRTTDPASPAYVAAITDRSTTPCPGTPPGVLTRTEITHLAASNGHAITITAKLVSTQGLETAAGGELTQCQFRPCATSAVWLILARGGAWAYSSPGGLSRGPATPSTTTTTLPPTARWAIYPLDPLTGRGLGDGGTGQGPDPAYFSQLADLDPPVALPMANPATGCRPVGLVTVSTDTAGARWYTYQGGIIQVVPPAGFNPLTATDDQLRRYGFPPRPPQGTPFRQHWDDAMAHAIHPAPPGLSTCPGSH